MDGKSYETPVCMLWSWRLPGGVKVRAGSRLVFPSLIEKRSIKTFLSKFPFVLRSKSADCSDKISACHVLCLKATIPEGSDTQTRSLICAA